jgi:3-phenylpropionate/trans-cinnamate dioxygenase ferredoxin reductase component
MCQWEADQSRDNSPYESEMDAMKQQYVIVGANLAGGTAAITLREEGFDGEIVLIGAEPHPPYERPPLSKEYLQGKKPFEESLLKPLTFYAEHTIQARLGVRATRVDPRQQVVELEDGDRVRYDKVLVATGVRNRRFRLPGMELEGIYDLRTVADADLIRAESVQGRRAVLVGMGFIGSEVAASLRHHGVEVTVIESFKTPLYRVLGEEVGRAFETLHREHGVQMFFEETVTALEGKRHVQCVVTSSGRRLDCDFVVVGMGVEPVTDILTNTDVQMENGIVVDEYCQTNVEGIYAAGDVANHYHPHFGRLVRVEHWQNAIHQGRAAARSMLGKREPYSDVHWFWSDQYDCNVQYAGFHTGWDELVVRGNLEERNAVVFYMQERRIAASVAFNRGRDLQRAMSLIRARVEVEPAILRDEGVDMRTLVPGAKPVRTHQHRIVARPVASPGEEVK